MACSGRIACWRAKQMAFSLQPDAPVFDARPAYATFGAGAKACVSNRGDFSRARISLLRLQQQRGNRYVQRFLAVARQREERPGVASEGGEHRTPVLHPTTHSQSSLQRACAGGTWNFEYDGCSMPASLANFLGIDPDNPAGGKDTQFALRIPSSAGGRACDRHDECYQTCHTLGGVAKIACDAQFLNDMLAICAASSESASVKAGCRAWAAAYWEAVSLFGGDAFDERQDQVCNCGT